jgi:hypothetical protein
VAKLIQSLFLKRKEINKKKTAKQNQSSETENYNTEVTFMQQLNFQNGST